MPPVEDWLKIAKQAPAKIRRTTTRREVVNILLVVSWIYMIFGCVIPFTEMMARTFTPRFFTWYQWILSAADFVCANFFFGLLLFLVIYFGRKLVRG